MNMDQEKAIKVMAENGMTPEAIATDSSWGGAAPTIGEIKTVLGKRRIITPNGRRNTNRFITHNGETRTLVEWTRIKGFGRRTISERLKNDWSVKDALETPMKIQKNNNPLT